VGTIKRVLLIGAVAGLMEAVRTGGLEVDDRVRSAAVVLGIGFVLITSLFVGKLFSSIGLPKLTGYLTVGILAGPAVLGFLDHAVVEDLRLVNGTAVGLIALTGGCEMDFRAMRPLLRSIAAVSTIAVVGTAVLLGITAFALSGWLPFLAEMPVPARVAVAAVLGVVVVAQSPAVVVAIRAETGADGPVARTALGVVVLADLLVITLFAIASAIASAVLAGTADVEATIRDIAWELFGSIGIGLLVGMILASYVRLLDRGRDLFVLTVCLVSAEVGARVHLDPLIIMLAAGMLVENAFHHGETLRRSFEVASLPVYILFFTVAGASIHLDAIPLVAVPAVVMVIVRAAGLYGGTVVATRLANAPPVVQRWAGFGLLPQAGLAIALGLLFAHSFPSFGAEAGTLTLSIVAINEILAPAVLRWAFVRSGEAADKSANGERSSKAEELVLPAWKTEKAS
jgi:Kef-type K+ transport system membrane component KefB